GGAVISSTNRRTYIRRSNSISLIRRPRTSISSIGSASAGPLGGAPAASGLCAAAGVINKVATTPARRGAAERLSSTLSASRSVVPGADRMAARQRRRRYAGRQMETRPWHAVCNLSPFVRRETQHETVLDVVRGR